MAPRIVVLDEMGPVNDQVLTFIREVCAPQPVEHVGPDAHDGADLLVCGDWRVTPRQQQEPGGTVLMRCFELGVPATVVYALLGGAELKRALRPRVSGIPAAAAWRHATAAGARVVILQVDRWHARRRFGVAEARAALPRVLPGQVALWHEPDIPLSI